MTVSGWTINWGYGARDFVVAHHEETSQTLELHVESGEFILPARPKSLPHWTTHRIPAAVFVEMVEFAKRRG